MIATKKKSSLPVILAALAAFFLLAVIVLLRADDARSTEPVVLRLWYVNDDRFSALLAEANGADILSGTGISLRIRRFESEEELAEALDTERPEMLYCSGSRAEALSRNGSLKSLSPYMESPPGIYSDLSGNDALAAGEFFPLCLETELLVFKTDAFARSGSFEALADAYSPEDGADAVPFFACPSFYDLFESLTAGSGFSIGSSRPDNAENAVFAATYNILAECAMNGSLYTGEKEPLQALLDGECLCSAVSSKVLQSVEFAAVDLPSDIGMCLPSADGSLFAEAFGLAITAEDEASAAACVPIIGKLVSLSSASGTLFSPNLTGVDFSEVSGRIRIGSYVPGSEALAGQFDEELARLFSILCE